MELNDNKLSQKVEEILRAQPLNPFVKLEFAASQPSWSMVDLDSRRGAEQDLYVSPVGGV